MLVEYDRNAVYSFSELLKKSRKLQGKKILLNYNKGGIWANFSTVKEVIYLSVNVDLDNRYPVKFLFFIYHLPLGNK